MAIRKTFGNKGGERLMKTLEKSRQANEFARGESKKPSGGTKPPKGGRAVPQGGRGSGGTRPPGGGNIRPAQKGGLPTTRTTTQPVEYKKPGGAVTEYKKPGGSVTKYEKPGTSVTEYKKPGGSVTKPSAGGVVAEGEGVLGKAGRLARGLGGLGAATAGFYFGDTFSSKTGGQANYGEKEALAKGLGPLMKGNKKYETPIGPKAPRGTAGTYTKSYDVKPKAAEPQKVTETPKTSLPAAPAKKAGDKSVLANKPKPSSASGAPAKPLTNFERMKARQYEKEGFGGRSLTAEQAKARVQKERSYKSPVDGLRFSDKSPSKAPAKAAAKQGSTSSFASKLQGQNVPGSPTYSGTKKGFKFKDLFNK